MADSLHRSNSRPVALEASLAVRYDLPVAVRPVLGCLYCPVPTCGHASYEADELHWHLRGHFFPPEVLAAGPQSPTVDMKRLLERLELKMEREHKLMVCQRGNCRHAVDPLDLRTHIADHGQPVSATELRRLTEKSGTVGLREFVASLGSSRIRAVPGIPVCRLVYFCVEPKCKKWAFNLKSLGKHSGAEHGKELTRFKLVGPCQAVFGYSKPMFRVEWAELEGFVLESEGSCSD
jgi:hypothetical protein